MNKNFIQQLQKTFNYLDKYIRQIVVAAVFFWLWHLGGPLLLALIFTALVLLWQISKWAMGKLLLRNCMKSIRGRIDSGLRWNDIREDSRSSDNKKIKLPVLLAAFVALTQAMILIFFLAILLYSGGKLSESVMICISITSAVLYILMSISGIDKNMKIKNILHKWSQCIFCIKIRNIFNHFLTQIITFIIYLFPFVVFTAFVIALGVVSFGLFSAALMQKVLFLYIIFMAFLVINYYTVHIQKGFLIMTGKIAAMLKTAVYILIPAILTALFIMEKSFNMAILFTFFALLLAGSCTLVYYDAAYRQMGVPILQQSGKVVVSTYFKYLLKYGAVFLIIIGIILGPPYFKEHDLKDIFTSEKEAQDFNKKQQGEVITESPFADLETGHWAVPAMAALYEAGIISPDENNNIHPETLLTLDDMLPLIYAYFGVKTEDFQQLARLDFVRIPRSEDRQYNLFKTAYYLNIIPDISVNPDAPATKEVLLRAIAILDGWAGEGETIDYIIMAKERGIIIDTSPEALESQIDRAVFAQILYNLK